MTIEDKERLQSKNQAILDAMSVDVTDLQGAENIINMYSNLTLDQGTLLVKAVEENIAFKKMLGYE